MTPRDWIALIDTNRKNWRKIIGELNYRICFEKPNITKKIDYPHNFDLCRQYYPILKQLYTEFLPYSSWHHFEPYVELTWLDFSDRGPELQERIFKFLKKNKYKIIELKDPRSTKQKMFADWYCESADDAIFGIKSMINTAKISMDLMEYELSKEKVKGIDRMMMRRFHVLCNQAAYSYSDEARLLNLRSVFAAISATGCGLEKAKKLYNEITGIKY